MRQETPDKRKSAVLVVDDDNNMRMAVREALVREGYHVETASDGREGMLKVQASEYALVVTDVKMPRVGGIEFLRRAKHSRPGLPVVVMTGFGTIENAVEAMKLGAGDYLVKPFELDDLIEAVRRNADRGLPENPDDLCRIPGGTGDKACIVTRDPGMLDLLHTARTVAASEATVLLKGESGTGKEMFAYYLHRHSRRADGPFVAVNCAALPENLLESELFGHEKGAFTGAIQSSKGKFELADGGTILLDEISEMNQHLQAKLLRVLQEREIDRVGCNRPVPVDIRVIATTNRDLELEVREGRFREDLYYRLNVIPLVLPPLRDRGGDVEILAEHFLHKQADKNGKKIQGFSTEAMEKLRANPWSGNVRELQNTVERGVLLAGSGMIEPSHLMAVCTLPGVSAGRFPKEPGKPSETVDAPVGVTLRDMEKDLIFRTLDQCGGNRTKAAKILGISIRTMRNKLNEYANRGEDAADDESVSPG